MIYNEWWKTGLTIMKKIGPTKFPKHQLSWETVVLSRFMRRHHKLNLRKPQLTSLATVSEFNEVEMHTIFDISVNNLSLKIKLHIRWFSVWTKPHTEPCSVLRKTCHKKTNITLESSDRANEYSMWPVCMKKCECFCVSLMLIYPRKMMIEILSYGAPQALLSVVKTEAAWIMKYSANGTVI